MTLVEVMVAIMLLSTAMMYIFLLFTKGMDSIKQTNRKIILVQLAQSKMEDYVASRSIVKTGDFSSRGYPEFKFRITTKSYGVSTLNLRQVTVEVYDGVRQVKFASVMTP